MVRIGLVVVAVGWLTLAPAASAAPAVSTDRACYANEDRLVLTGTGFTPQGRVTVEAVWVWSDGSYDDAGTLTTTADAAGAIELESMVLTTNLIDPQTMKVTATDETLAAQGVPEADRAASTTVKTVNRFVLVEPWNTDGPAPGRPGRSVTAEVFGFTDAIGKTVYMHYVRGGRAVHTEALGRPRGDCGRFKHRFRQFAFRPLRAGRYGVSFSTHRTYRASESVGYTAVVVRRRDARD